MNVELVRPGKPWWNDLTELAMFGRWMEETGRLIHGREDLWYVVEKPWKYDGEHEEMLREEAVEHAYEEERSELERRYQL